MSEATPASRVRTTDDFIKTQSTTHPVRALCRVLTVAPSGHHAWLEERVSSRAPEDAAWSG
jgi:hypothetical protein